MLSMTIPALVALIGVLVYAISKNPEAREIGRIAYACGLLVFLAQVATDRIVMP